MVSVGVPGKIDYATGKLDIPHRILNYLDIFVNEFSYKQEL